MRLWRWGASDASDIHQQRLSTESPNLAKNPRTEKSCDDKFQQSCTLNGISRFGSDAAITQGRVHPLRPEIAAFNNFVSAIGLVPVACRGHPVDLLLIATSEHTGDAHGQQRSPLLDLA